MDIAFRGRQKDMYLVIRGMGDARFLIIQRPRNAICAPRLLGSFCAAMADNLLLIE